MPTTLAIGQCYFFQSGITDTIASMPITGYLVPAGTLVYQNANQAIPPSFNLWFNATNWELDDLFGYAIAYGGTNSTDPTAGTYTGTNTLYTWSDSTTHQYVGTAAIGYASALVVDNQGNITTTGTLSAERLSFDYGYITSDGSGDITIVGNETDNGLTVQGALTVTGGAGTILSGTLNVTGASTLTDILTVSGSHVTSLGGTLAVTGATTLASTLGVTGATTLSSTLSVAGLATLAGGLAKVTHYNGSATAGLGLAPIIYTFAPVTNGSASVGGTQLVYITTSTTIYFRCNYLLSINTVGTGSVSVGIDASGTQLQTSASLSLATVGGYQTAVSGSFIFSLSASGYMHYRTTYTGTGSYNLQIIMEQLA